MTDECQEGASGSMEVARIPCSTCPYRKDVPSGLWAQHEYDKLREYDQHPGPLAPFLCHQTTATGTETACRGWLSTHADGIAVRLAMMSGSVTMEQVDAEVPVEMYATGNEAADAGMAEYEEPSPQAVRAQERLIARGIGRA